MSLAAFSAVQGCRRCRAMERAGGSQNRQGADVISGPAHFYRPFREFFHQMSAAISGPRELLLCCVGTLGSFCGVLVHVLRLESSPGMQQVLFMLRSELQLWGNRRGSWRPVYCCSHLQVLPDQRSATDDHASAEIESRLRGRRTDLRVAIYHTGLGGDFGYADRTRKNCRGPDSRDLYTRYRNRRLWAVSGLHGLESQFSALAVWSHQWSSSNPQFN